MLVACAALLAASSGAFAQTAPAARPAVAQALPTDNANQITEEKEKVIKLSPFIVTSADGGYAERQTMLGSRTAEAIIDLPSSVAIMNKQLINDLNAFDVQQTLNVGVSGVTQNSVITDDVNIRGFRSLYSLRDGIIRHSTFKRNPMYDVERIEVLKGPAALQLGNNAFLGGAVNYVSMRPKDTPSGYIRTTISDNSYARSEGNVSGPIVKNEDYTINYRLTGGSLTGKREKEIEGKEDELFLGGGLDIFFGKDTRVQGNAYWFMDNAYRGWNDFLDIGPPGTPPPTATTLREAKLHPNSTKRFSPGRSKDVFMDAQSYSMNVAVSTKLTPNLYIRAYYSFDKIHDARGELRGLTVRSDNFTLDRTFGPYTVDLVGHSSQLDILHELETKWFTLNSTWGLDLHLATRAQKLSTHNMPALDTRIQGYPLDDAFFAVPRAGTGGLPNTTQTGFENKLFTYYLQENLALFNKRLILVGGIRAFQPTGINLSGADLATITQRSMKKFDVMKLGVVFKIRPWLSAYYTEAGNVFIAQPGRTDKFSANDQLGELLKDQDGTLKEFGVKFDHSFTPALTMHGSVALFDMSLTNVRTFGDLGNGVQGIIQSARDTSQGWECDFGGSYTIGQGAWSMIATYFDGDSATAVDSRLQAVGFAPKKISFLAKYSWSGGGLKGLTIGGNIMDQTPIRNGFWLLDYPAVVNVFAGYKWRQHWQIHLNLDNVTNKRYIVATASTGLVQTAEDFRARLGVTYRW